MKIVQVIQIDHVQEEEIRITTPNKNLVAEPEIISIQEIHNFMVICYRTGIKMVMEEVKAHLIILLIIHLIMVKVKKAHLQMIIHMVIIDHHQIVIAIVLQIQICLKILEVIVKMILMKKMKKALKRKKVKVPMTKKSHLDKVLEVYLIEVMKITEENIYK